MKTSLVNIKDLSQDCETLELEVIFFHILLHLYI